MSSFKFIKKFILNRTQIFYHNYTLRPPPVSNLNKFSDPFTFISSCRKFFYYQKSFVNYKSPFIILFKSRMFQLMMEIKAKDDNRFSFLLKIIWREIYNSCLFLFFYKRYYLLYGKNKLIHYKKKMELKFFLSKLAILHSSN